MPNLSNKTNREKLKPRSAVYTQVLAPGRALGYRRRDADSPGRWVLRTAKNDGGYGFETLGVADDRQPADGKEVLSYSQALALALGRRIADPTKVRVIDALRTWARDKAVLASSDKQAMDYFNAAERVGSRFGNKTIKTISARDITAWLDQIVADGEDTRKRRATANRQLAILKAALTRAADAAEYQGNRAWLSVSKFAKAESFGARLVILTSDEEDRLIEAARPDVATLLRALQMTGARFGEMRTCMVSDFSVERLTLTGKTGTRTIALSPDKAAYFAALAADCDQDAPLLRRQDGRQWPDGGQLKPVAKAVRAAGLPDVVTTYAFRHGFISRALAKGVPVAAVAQHTGTSVDMIMAAYAKFAPAQMAEWFG